VSLPGFCGTWTILYEERETYRIGAGLWHYDVFRSGVTDAVETLLNRLRELPTNGQHRIDAQRMRDAATSAGRSHGRQVGEDPDQNVVVVCGRRLIRETEGTRQPGPDPHHRGGTQHTEGPRPSAAFQRDLGVRVSDGRVALAHPDDPRHQILRRRGVSRRPLDREEVAELKRRKAIDVVDAERLALLRLDVDLRRRQEVGREQVEIVDIPHTDGRYQVLVSRQALGAPSGRHVEDVGPYDRRGRGSGRRWVGQGRRDWTGGDEHHHRRRLVVRYDHVPKRRQVARPRYVAQVVLATVSLHTRGMFCINLCFTFRMCDTLKSLNTFTEFSFPRQTGSLANFTTVHQLSRYGHTQTDAEIFIII